MAFLFRIRDFGLIENHTINDMEQQGDLQSRLVELTNFPITRLSRS